MPYYSKEKNSWVGQIRINGRKIKKTGFETKKEAQKWEVVIREEGEVLKTPTTCLVDLATAYLAFCEAKFCQKTKGEKVSVFKSFFAFKGVNPQVMPEQFVQLGGKRLVAAYLAAQKTKRSGYSANKDRKNLVAWWNWCVKYYDVPTPNPFMVDKMPETRSPRYVPPLDDFMAVLNVCNNIQDKTMLQTFLYTAARRGEVFRLIWTDIDIDRKTIRLSTRKRADGTLEYDILPMPESLALILREYRRQATTFNVFATDKGEAYQYRQKLMSKLCAKAKVKAFGFHAIRHLTATFLWHNGVEIQQIQAILRHKSSHTTERYLKSLGLNKVRAALDILPDTAQIMNFKKPPAEPPAKMATF